jgi:glycosyltransferase involved in cell wall biosynthesis
VDALLREPERSALRHAARTDAIQLAAAVTPARLAIIATHPIQYAVPWFQRLALQPDLEVVVYYALMPTPAQQGAGFGMSFAWDVDLLGGYRWELLDNAARHPSLDRFLGCRTPTVARSLARWKPDVALITGWQALSLLEGLWASMRLRIPRIVRGDSNAMQPRRRVVRMLHRVLLSRFDAYLAVGRSNRELYAGYGVPECRIFDCPHFVDNERFQQQAADLASSRRMLRAEWGIPQDAVCFLYAGKLVPKKRILDLLRSLDLARASGCRMHLLVVGTGELLERARAVSLDRALPVTFAGFLNQREIVRAYVAADCLVLPSDYGETWGLVVNEAMACGLPALVSDRVGCGPDLVEDRVTGAVFPFGDVGALADRLMQLAARGGQLSEMGTRARERVVTRYSVERAVAGTKEAVAALTCRSGA